MSAKCVLIAWILVPTFLVTSSCARPRESAQGDNENHSADFDEQQRLEVFLTSVPALIERARVPGMSLAIIQGGDIEWFGSFGVKNVDTKEVVDRTTLFEAASLSKPLCAYVALRMVDRGELDLDAPLASYIEDSVLKEFLGEEFDDDRIGSITTRMILTHSSGLPNWRRDQPLTILFQPGQRFSYSGEGFVLLQQIMEEICACEYAALMEREVFDPLGMQNSDFRWLAEYDGRIATRHDLLGETAERNRPARVHAAGTLLTTAEDYAKFLVAVMKGTGLSADSRAELLSTQIEFPGHDGTLVSWGLGVGLDDSEGVRAIWHHGDNYTTRAFALALPELGDGVVYFTNGENGLGIIEEIVQGSLGSAGSVRTFRNWSNYLRIDAPEFLFVYRFASDGPDAALAFLTQQLRDSSEEGEPFSEELVNDFGYRLLETGDVEHAVAFFELNVEAFPESSNAHDSLGEGYMTAGDTALAIQSYERSLVLNPANENARRQLRLLRAR